jgi:signal transduction histidine kinase
LPPVAVSLEISDASGGTRRIPVRAAPFRIGSDPGADLPLSAPGIFPHHAQIILLGGAHRLVPGRPGLQLRADGKAVPQDGVALVDGARIELAPACPVQIRFLVDDGRERGQPDRLVTLVEVARTITSSLALDEVLDRVIEGAVRISGAQRGYLFLREGDSLVPWRSGREDSANIEVSRSVAEEVARTGRPVYRDRLGHESGVSLTASIVRLRLQAILCLPLAVRQDVIGVVYLDSRRPLPQHQPDLPLLEALAGLAAVAIQNTRLVDDRVRTERTLVMGRMARAIVHDLRSPLAAVRGLADLVRERAADGDSARPHLTTIISEIDRLSALIGDLLQFSTEAPALVRARVRLAELVRQTLEPLAPRLAAAGIRLLTELDEGARASVDEQRMLRLLHNLIANAIEAMPGGGTLTLRIAPAAGGWHLAVRDSGCGMSEEVRRRVFEPFFSHGKPNGTGLGMAIVLKIAEEHGASIRIDTAPGRGTEVDLILPAEESPLQLAR